MTPCNCERFGEGVHPCSIHGIPARPRDPVPTPAPGPLDFEATHRAVKYAEGTNIDNYDERYYAHLNAQALAYGDRRAAEERAKVAGLVERLEHAEAGPWVCAKCGEDFPDHLEDCTWYGVRHRWVRRPGDLSAFPDAEG